MTRHAPRRGEGKPVGRGLLIISSRPTTSYHIKQLNMVINSLEWQNQTKLICRPVSYFTTYKKALKKSICPRFRNWTPAIETGLCYLYKGGSLAWRKEGNVRNQETVCNIHKTSLNKDVLQTMSLEKNCSTRTQAFIHLAMEFQCNFSTVVKTLFNIHAHISLTLISILIPCWDRVKAQTLSLRCQSCNPQWANGWNVGVVTGSFTTPHRADRLLTLPSAQCGRVNTCRKSTHDQPSK